MASARLEKCHQGPLAGLGFQSGLGGGEILRFERTKHAFHFQGNEFTLALDLLAQISGHSPFIEVRHKTQVIGNLGHFRLDLPKALEDEIFLIFFADD